MAPEAVAGWVLLGVFALVAGLFVVTFVLERDARPALITLLVSSALLAGLACFLLFDFPGRYWVFYGVTGLLLLVVAAVALVGTRNRPLEIVDGGCRVDERDAVFHRFYRLKPDTPQWNAYYEMHPEKCSFDEKIRAMPGLSEPGSRSHHPITSGYQTALFDECERVTRDVELKPPPGGGEKVEASPEDMAARIKGFARYMGALDVGCTVLNPLHVYSNIGRSPGDWGAPIQLDHTHAVAITVPMSHEMLRLAPASPTTTETAFEYLEAARIAMVVARYISLLGYRARAHVDGNYRVMCVPVAADAGLGELGRLGLLITPGHGPRVRLAVVTTDMPLAQDAPIAFGVQDFCAICKKCADICPSGSVDGGDKREINGAVKWQTVQDSCYRYWRMVGSDCALCVKVCPYSHPSNPAHDAVRWAIGRNGAARRAALWADDLMYGRKPDAVYPVPDWHRESES